MGSTGGRSGTKPPRKKRRHRHNMNIEKQLYSFFVDFWRLVKKYATQPDTEEEWKNLTDEASALHSKHNNEKAEGRFYRACIVTWLEYIHERELERKGDSTIKKDLKGTVNNIGACQRLENETNPETNKPHRACDM